MKVSIVKIGNSQGIRIPKPIIEQCGFESEVELEVLNQEVVIRPINHIRQGWDAAFASLAEQGDDTLLESPPTSWDEEEWEWK